MITPCLSCLTQEVLIKTTMLPQKTNQENSGGAERREDTPAHSMSCKTNPEALGRGQKEEGEDRMSCQPPRNLQESILAER